MSKTNTNRSRKAKATVRTTRATLDKRNKRLGGKPRSPEVVTKEINTRKVDAALCSKGFNSPPRYRVDTSFTLNNTQDLNDPIDWLATKMGKDVYRMCTGSGSCLMTGLRDFSWEGTKSEMTAVLKWLARSPYRIHEVHTSMADTY